MSNDSMEEIMNRIKARRLELNLSFQDLANLTNLSKSTLQRYESGMIKNIPLDKLKILATALQVTPEWIMGWEESHEKENDEIEIDTIAAHALRDLTEEEQQKILEYAKFIKAQRTDKK